MTTTQLPTSSTTTSTTSDNNSSERDNINNNNNISSNNNKNSNNNKSSAATTTTTTTASTNHLITAPTIGLSNGIGMQRTNSTSDIILTSPSPHNSSTSTARPMQSDEDFNIRFVNLVRIHRCLYDKKVPEYRNRDNQEKSWMLISQETQESVIHCKERWRNLRACLSRYIKQQNSNDPQHKPYYLTEHMAFLLPYLKSTRNSLDGNNSLAQLFQYSQLQQQQSALHVPSSITGGASLQALAQSHFQANGLLNDNPKLEFKHSLSDNDDEETIDAFDPAITASFQQQHQQQLQQNEQQQQQQQQQQRHANGHCSSPTPSDTASANSLQNFIPDVQLSELRTPVNGDFSHEPKRIKTECGGGDNSSMGHMASQHHLYCSGSIDNADMEFFRSILPDIASLTPQQKRKFKIGILELIDEVMVKYPADKEVINQENSSGLNHSTSGNSSAAPAQHNKSRRSSARSEWRK